MNSGPNSDSKQCPESKLGQVHSVHTLDPGCAHAARSLRLGPQCHVVSWRALAPCRGCAPAVSQPVAGFVMAMSQACRCGYAVVSLLVCITSLYTTAPLGHDTSLYHNKLLVACRVARRIACLPGCVAALARSCSGLSRDTPSGQAMRALPAMSQGLSAVSWPLLTVSWPRQVVSWPLQLRPAALCHDTIHCILTQMGSSPSSCLLSRFFFSPFFFSFQLQENHQNLFFFCSFSSRAK